MGGGQLAMFLDVSGFFFPPPDAKAMGTWEPARYTLQVTL